MVSVFQVPAESDSAGCGLSLAIGYVGVEDEEQAYINREKEREGEERRKKIPAESDFAGLGLSPALLRRR